ncbi:hypothetical protein HDU81_003836 [Chytriomyces hyalinus]|nr:hypothetical protein HDU81_003836 [Chytriomyces hyalinus]
MGAGSKKKNRTGSTGTAPPPASSPATPPVKVQPRAPSRERDDGLEERRREVSASVIAQMKNDIKQKDEQIRVLLSQRRDSLDTLQSPGSVTQSATSDAPSPSASDMTVSNQNSKDLANLNTQISTLTQSCALLNTQNVELQSTLTAEQKKASEQITRLESQLSSVSKADADNKAQIKALEAHASQQAKTIADLRDKLAAASAASANQQQTAANADAKKIKSLEAQILQLQEMVKTREIEMHAGIVERDRLTKDGKEKATLIATLKKTIMDMESGVTKVLQGPVSSALKLGVISKDIHRFSQQHWAPDESVSACSMSSCETKFGLIQRKHHCRCCGLIFCASHSAQKMRLSIANHKYDSNGVETRVCDGCFRSATVI